MFHDDALYKFTLYYITLCRQLHASTSVKECDGDDLLVRFTWQRRLLQTMSDQRLMSVSTLCMQRTCAISGSFSSWFVFVMSNKRLLSLGSL